MKELMDRIEDQGGLGFALAWAMVPGLVLLLALAGHGQAPDWERVVIPDGAIFHDPAWDEPNGFEQAPSPRLAADTYGRLYFANGGKLHHGAGSTWSTLSKPKAAWSLTQQRPLAAGSHGTVIWGEWCSKNGGATWDSLSATAGFAYACAVLKDGTGLLGHAYDAIERSGGYAGSWTQVHRGNTFGHIEHFAVGESAIFALPSHDQILLSTDSGKNWREWSNSGSHRVSGLPVRAARLQRPSQGTPLILALDRTDDQPNALVRLHTFFPGLDTLKGALPDSAITSLWFDPEGNIWLGTRGQGVRVSRDGGRTYTAVNGGLASLFVEGLESTSDGTLYALTRGGLYRARSGITGLALPRALLAPRSPARARLHLPGLPAPLRGDRPKARLSVLADGRMVILPAENLHTPFPR